MGEAFSREAPTTSRSLGVDIARLFAVLVVAVLLQTTVAPFIRVLGANPDFVLIIVVCVGLLRGASWGASSASSPGALVSLILFEPLA